MRRNRPRNSEWFQAGAISATLLILATLGCAESPAVSEKRLSTVEQTARDLAQRDVEVVHLQQTNRELAVEQERLRVDLASRGAEIDSLRAELSRREGALDQKERGILAYHEEVSRLRRQMEVPVPVELTKGAGVAPGLSDLDEARKKMGPYHLRIIALPRNPSSEDAIRDIASYLEDQGIEDIRCRTSGSYWVVDIGNFDSPTNLYALRLKDRILDLEYEHRRQFSSAYFVTY